MSKILIHNAAKLNLRNLLRRRKQTLEDWVKSSGISNYAELVRSCERIGCMPVSQKDFEAVMPHQVNDPQEGVIVIEPLPVIDEHTGLRFDPEEVPHIIPGVFVVDEYVDVDTTTTTTAKRNRRSRSA